MKKISNVVGALGLLVLAVIGVREAVQVVRAGVSCSVPNNLQNGQPADATQVMANFNALIACFSNSAAAGPNSDITALNGLTTPIAPSSGGTTIYTGGTSTGGANAQVVAVTVPSSVVLAAGTKIVFISGFLNTGPTTLAVGSTGTINLYRKTQLGVKPLAGGELNVGQLNEATYDGTQWQLSDRFDVVGEVKDYLGGSPPNGWVQANGQCISQTGAGAALFSIVGTSLGSCSAGQFAVLNATGAATFASGGTTCSSGAIGATCGAATSALSSTNQLPQFTPAGSVAVSTSGAVVPVTSVGVTGAQAGTTGPSNVAQATSGGWSGIGPGLTGTLSGTPVGSASPSSFSVQNPAAIVFKMVKL